MPETPAEADAQPTEDTEQPQGKKLEFEQYPADHPLVRRLEELKAENNELKPKAKRLTELEEASKSESEKLTDRLNAEMSRADTAEAELLRYKVATEEGVPAKAMKFLTGTTIDEIKASAKEVMQLIGDAGKPRTPKPDPNQGRSGTEVTDPATQFAAILRQQLDNA